MRPRSCSHWAASQQAAAQAAQAPHPAETTPDVGIHYDKAIDSIIIDLIR